MSAGVDVVMAPLHPRDRGAIAAIVRATGVFRESEVAVALELFDEGCAAGGATVGSEDYRFLGLYVGSALAGYACWGPTPDTDDTHDLYWIAVDPTRHGRGAGTRLLAAVEACLREAHARLLVVETSSRPDYAPTRGFYRARGYAEAARVRDWYAPGDDRVLFVKRLFPRSPAAPPGAE